MHFGAQNSTALALALVREPGGGLYLVMHGVTPNQPTALIGAPWTDGYDLLINNELYSLFFRVVDSRTLAFTLAGDEPFLPALTSGVPFTFGPSRWGPPTQHFMVPTTVYAVFSRCVADASVPSRKWLKFGVV
jgi:hypothetical protein